MGRAALRLVALTTALVLVFGVAGAAQAQTGWSGRYNLYREGVFVTQYTWTWCVGASAQAMLNIINDTSNDRYRRQRRLVQYAMNHDQHLNSNTGGSDAVGFARTLNHHGGGPYSVATARSFRVAVRRAVRRMRLTAKPVGLLVMGGRHAWVLSGFEATADPARTDDFEVTHVYVMGPLYPKQTRGYYDMKPNTRLTLRQFRTPFRKFDDPDSPRFVGYWVTVNPQ
jgi:short subunit dehydrogenase-like uncharacterized protein